MTQTILALLFVLVLFVIMVYKRISGLIVAPVLTVLLALLTGMDPTETLLDGYMGLASNYVRLFFLVFLTGAIFAQILHKTGAAASIAEGIVDIFGEKAVIPAMVLSTAVLTYGGISLFIIFFIMYPMGLVMHKKANLTKILIPGEIALGAFTFSMTTPGSPQVQNIIPTKYLGTSPTAGFIPGWIAGILIAILGILYLKWRAKKHRENGLEFESYDELEDEKDETLPNFWISITPSIVVIILLNIVKLDIVWAMSFGIIASVILLWNRLDISEWNEAIAEGAKNSTLIIMMTAAIVGFAGAVKLLPDFPKIVNFVQSMSVNDYYFPAISTGFLSGISASSSGGLSVTFEALTETFFELGIPMFAVHRIASMAAGTIDSLPHCPAIINLLEVTKTSYADAYKDIFVTTILIPLLAIFFVLVPLFMIMS